MSNQASYAKLILDWYDIHQRTLPWRAAKGQTPEPYHVLVSEIMLQQTQVATVISYFNRFIEKFPTINDLANASLDQVLTLWSGLGYYSRARNLHRCAQQVVEMKGKFPQDFHELKKLAGIGDYTANAILSIAFNKPVVAVDGNVERLTARLFAILDPLPKAKLKLRHKAETLNLGSEAIQRASDFSQALFDLGATICKPKAPLCLLCPLREKCKSLQLNIANQLPRRQPKLSKPTRYGISFLIIDAQKQIFLTKRQERGILANTLELPGSEWSLQPLIKKNIVCELNLNLDWNYKGQIKHSFTHFNLIIDLYSSETVKSDYTGLRRGQWVSVDKLSEYPCSTLLKKMIHQGMKENEVSFKKKDDK